MDPFYFCGKKGQHFTMIIVEKVSSQFNISSSISTAIIVIIDSHFDSLDVNYDAFIICLLHLR